MGEALLLQLFLLFLLQVLIYCLWKVDNALKHLVTCFKILLWICYLIQNAFGVDTRPLSTLSFIMDVIIIITIIHLIMFSFNGQNTLLCLSSSFVAISDYKQSLQFQDLNEHKRNIHLEVCFLAQQYFYYYYYYHHHHNFMFQFVLEKVIRDGRRVEISIYDVVVGDVIPLNIGNQVCLIIFAYHA